MAKQYWEEKRVLVTGCTGLLGSWLTNALLARNAEVVGIVRDRVPQSELRRTHNIDKIRVVYGDITDESLLERTIAEYEIHTIIHLAAQTTVGIAHRAPLPTFETNIRGTWLLLEAARHQETVKSIVVASSDKAYGKQPSLPYPEDAALRGLYPYDVSKTCTDLIARTYANTYDMPVVVTRCANLFGGGDLNWNRLIPGTIRSVLKGKRPIIRSDGTPKRDFIYVKDAVNAYLLAAEHANEAGIKGEAFNFGMDRPLMVKEMIQAIVDSSGQTHLEPIILDEVRNETKDQYLDSSKASRVLGWQHHTDLQTSLTETIDWYRNFLTQSTLT